jgi:recombination protein RecT
VTFPGVHAFPGGVLDAHDSRAPGAAVPTDQAWAPVGEGDQPHEALPYWVTAVRELFEELGVLLAHDTTGRPLAALRPEIAALRAALDGRTALADLLAPHGLVPATRDLYYFARWITPTRNPRRFDTRFLVGRMPEGQNPTPDGTETESCEWLSPRAALARFARAEIDLIPPTLRTLEDLARFPSVEAVLRDASGRVVRAGAPEVEQVAGQPMMHFEGAPGPTPLPARRVVLRDGRWRPAED